MTRLQPKEGHAPNHTQAGRRRGDPRRSLAHRLLGEMRRKSPGQPPPVVPVRLYLEDVRALYDELANASGGATLETNEFEFEGPDDLLNLGRDRLSTLTLRGTSSDLTVNVSVLLTEQGASVERWGDAAEAIVVADKLRQILLGCRRRLHWLFSWWMIVLWLGLYAAGLELILAVGGWTGGIVGGLLIGLALVGMAALFLMRTHLGSVVHLRRRRDSRSFLGRNSDTLIVTGVVSLVTAVVSALLTYYLTTRK
jgi:hypothetical protein